MSDYVVDASTAVSALVRMDAVGIATRKRLNDVIGHAPHLLDAEVGSSLRRGERLGEIDSEMAQTSLIVLETLVDFRYPHTGQLAFMAWELRHTITFYDAMYVALATVLDVPLLTADRKLSKAPGLTCAVELVG